MTGHLKALVVVAAVLAALIIGSACLNSYQRQDLRGHSDQRWASLSQKIDALAKQCAGR